MRPETCTGTYGWGAVVTYLDRYLEVRNWPEVKAKDPARTDVLYEHDQRARQVL